MIIKEKVKDLVVIGEHSSKKATISQNKLAKLQYLLTKGLYKDPITAVIAEWTNNGIDSVVQAGKSPVDNPVLVKIEKGEGGQYVFRVEDKGTGLDDREFEDICMSYLESTKESDNDTIGHFGIGMKSFLSLERSATFTCIKDKVERKYLVYEGAEFVNYDLIYEKPTDEENGVIAELSINNWNERWQFVQKATNKLSYYDTAVLVIDGIVKQNDIYRNDLFQWSSTCDSHFMHLCLKDVYYPIDWEALGIPQIRVPVALRMSLSEGVTPTPSRESYITNERTKEILSDRIGKVADWFVNRYNETVRNFKTFLEAYEYLGQIEFHVEVHDKHFKINELLEHTDLKPDNIRIEGIKLLNPLKYKSERHEMLRHYTISGYTNYNGIMKKEGNAGVSIENHVFNRKNITVLVDDRFRGNVKEFLKHKYPKNTLFVRENGYKRPLLKPREVTASGAVKFDGESYKAILGLSSIPRNKWREYVAEWNLVVSTVVATFKDERFVEIDDDYKDWLEKKKEEQRQKRRLAGTPGYSGLGKQLGDVTLAYSYVRHNRIYFAKKAFPIDGLHRNQFLTVLVTDENDIELVKGIVASMKGDKVRFALVGNKEIKKIPEHFQFINFQAFMGRNCKPFMRLASAIKFDELLEQYRQVKNYQEPIFKRILKHVNKDAKKLEEYVTANLGYFPDKEVRNKIIDAADLNDLYDKELWGEYKRLREEVERFDFIALITPPNAYNHELKDRYNRLINQYLLFRKKYYKDLENAEIVFKKTKTEEDEMV